MKLKFCIIIIAFISISYTLNGQDIIAKLFNEDYDSTYYDKLQNLITVRTFLSSKFSDFTINDNAIDQSLIYNSKPKTALGIGFSYKWLSINIGLGLKNSAGSSQGNTNRFDLQTQIYLRKLTLNLYSSIYNGFYLSNSQQFLNTNLGEDYHRNDIKDMTFGFSTYYVFNSSKYSNKATFIQNEWQKKTAGSFVAGGNIFYNQINGDSSLIPYQNNYPNFFTGIYYSKSSYLGIGSNVGYTFTLILLENWFFDFTILGGITIGNSTIYLDNNEKKSSAGLGLNLSNRFGMGYNSKLFYVGINYTNIQSNTSLPIPKMGYGFGLGRIKFIFAYRFNLPEHKVILPSWVPFKL